ncbi:UDP-glucose 4-epimerase [Candidatus Pelagibacter sp. HTCC7211]|uniref:UDP-glucose 4-epimerase GalE n=1 Tax=Pelagibacter sp. (strain HTCC7211) TaxID=439493 RepID=UPI000183A8D4|nr:UDP-glucose 4-epimerase GalE [Candidatus Pelagibacter sp. HTCC7211]EDZ59890.1 UDP-glucose 4-epimerase [Candidatus Pelagibacter sp. HTCC7211]MBD1151163.1 UDP-glucose 4-epimerase GalE [Pelagibacterales bacterium SAG-MED25]
MKNVFITGGAGYIGSHCAISLFKNGYNPIILDNFSNSRSSVIKNLEIITDKKITFYDVDIRDKKKLISIFKKISCYAVIHCAGLKSVAESIRRPIDYFDNNIGSTLSLLECMRKSNVFKLIFSSSATVYDNNQLLPLKETNKTGNIKNPYGNTKYIIERILMDLVKSDYRWSIRIARYFNPISNHSSGLIKENPKGIPNNLIPCIIKVAQKKLPILKVFGKNYKTKDGTGVRDYIHVMDLADGHVAMIKNNRLKKGLKIYNFGTGKGSSVLEVIRSFEKHTGILISFKFTKRRTGDVAESFCSANKAIKELNWKYRYDLKQAMIDIKKIL